MYILTDYDHKLLRYALRLAGIGPASIVDRMPEGARFVVALGQWALDRAVPGYDFQIWRGSLIRNGNLKVFVTWSVEHVMKFADDFALWLVDLRRAKRHFQQEIQAPQPKVHKIPDLAAFMEFARTVREQQLELAFDLEGDACRILCIGFSASAQEAWVVPWEEPWLTVAKELLEDPNVPKSGHNVNFDRYVLARNGVVVPNIRNDTMISHWCLFPGTRKDLGTLAKLYAEMPPYKHTMSQDLYEYCGKDAVSTWIISRSQQTLGIPQYGHRLLRLQDAFLWFSLKGIRLDVDGILQECRRLEHELAMEQATIDELAGFHVNPMSSPQLRDLFHVTSSAYEVLLDLLWKQPENRLLRAVLRFRKLRKQLSLLASLHPDLDQRCRCSYNIVGTYTGRTSCTTTPEGVGTNLQTVPKEFRRFFLADEGYWLGQCDLSGADGWTVAARAASLGDPTMLDDYQAGLKPARVLAVWMKFGRITDRDELKRLGKQVEDDLYFACKRIQHGSNYMMGPKKLAQQVFLDSEGQVYLSESDALQLQQLYFTRYPGVIAWHRWVRQRLARNMPLESASGHRHTFWLADRREVLTKALAFEPQHNTTWATNLALEKMSQEISPDFYPVHHVHDALVFQFRDPEWVGQRLRKWFHNELHIGGVSVVIPFEGAYGRAWGLLNHEFPA